MRLPLACLVFAAAAAFPAAAQTNTLPYIFSTFAGSTAGTSGYLDATGTDARFARPWGLTLDATGNLYVTEIANHTIRKVTPTGVVTTLAGRPGISGWLDGSVTIALFGGSNATPPGTSASSVVPTGPFGITRDTTGNLFIADSVFQVLRQLTPSSVVSTLAGTPQIPGYLDGPAAVTQFKTPLGLTALPDGSLLVADSYNHVIRKISVSGTVTTVAGIPGTPGSLDGPAQQALFLAPCAIVVASDGTLYVTDANNLVRRLTPTTTSPTSYTVNTIAGSALIGGSVDGQGAAARFGAAVETLQGVTAPFNQNPAGNPGPTGGSISLYAVGGLTGAALAPDGNVIIADYYNQTIRQVTPSGLVTTIGGKAVTRGRVDGVGTAATFSSPAGVAIDAAGNIYVADSLNNTIRKGTRAVAPSISSPPASRSVAAGATHVFSVTVAGFPAPSYQWSKDGAPLSGATNATLTLASLSSSATGSYTVTATNDYGTATSSTAMLSVVTLPVISAQPTSRPWLAGETIALSVAANAGPDATFQWFRAGVAVAGATSATLTIPNAQPVHAGAYTVAITNLAGTVTSTEVIVEVRASRIINLSVRSALTPAQSLTVGFVVNGIGKPLLIRAIGPALRQFGLPTAMADPVLLLSSPTGTVGTNDNWSTVPLANEVAATAQRVGAFALAPGSLDAALLATVGNSALTAQAVGNNQSGGVVLLELYDAASETPARLINVSTRATAGAGDNALVAGFVISGNAPRKVLVRAIGPTLAGFGVPGTLADPKLDVFAAGSATALATNDNWGGTAALSTAFVAVGAFPLADSASRDAALVLTLEPGSYSAQITGVGGTTGEVLLEVYEHP